MPQIPTYNGPQARTEALRIVPQQGASTDAAFGGTQARQLGNFGEALQRTGQQGLEAAFKIQDREDADAAFRAETALKAEWLQFEQNARKRQGRDAQGLITETEGWWAQAEEKFNKDLNPRQQRLLANSAVRLRQQTLAGMAEYENVQMERSHDESWAASKVTSISAAAANPKPEVIATTVAELQKKNAYQAARKGWSPEQLEAANLKDTTTLHTNVIRRLVAQPSGAKAAQEYFDTHSKEIDGTLYDEIEPVIKKAVTEQTAKETADSLSGVSLEDGLKKIGEIEDPELRSATRQAFLLNKKDEELIQQARERGASDRVWQAIANGRKPTQADLAAMDGRERIEVTKYFDAKAKATAVNGRLHAKEDNYDVLDMAEAQIKQGDITDPKQLERYAPFLRAETFRTLRTSLEKRSSVPRGDVERAFFERLGKGKAQALKSEKTRNQWLAFQDYINDNVRETKRPEDLDSWADKWFSSGYGKDNSIFRNDPDTYGEARAAGRTDFVIETPSVAKPVVDSTLAFVRSAGINVPSTKAATDEFYTNFYLDAQRWYGARGEQLTPSRAAAYAILKQNNKPVTPANINAVLQQLKGAPSAGSGQPAR